MLITGCIEFHVQIDSFIKERMQYFCPKCHTFGGEVVPQDDCCENCKARDRKARDRKAREKSEKRRLIRDLVRRVGEMEDRLERLEKRGQPWMTSCQLKKDACKICGRDECVCEVY